MNDQKKNTGKVWAPLLFSVVLIFGMIVGFNLRDTLRNKRDLGVVLERNDRLEEVIDLIREKYVDTVNTNLLYKDAVNGILKTLDPHTVYIPADQLQGVNDDLEGSFIGIGIEFSILHDTIEVTNVLENGPAAAAGVQVGDQLVKVDDSVVAGTGITSDRIMHLLRGKKHTSVIIALKRSSLAALKQLPITREIIPISSIDASFMMDSITGFIKISRFSANTYNDFGKALKGLKDLGAKQLIIDLRENPGGFLKAATSIADELLDEEKLILYTRGIHSPKTEYKAADKGLFETGKLAVLIDEGSASASEILAGAIQDWDRGVIIGRRSYGKGLVQEQYDLADGSALRLTVAKYYTPSGRCVQRSFANGKDAYREDYEKRFQSGELTGKESPAPLDSTKYYTSNRRVVYGGGGISPDVYVPYDTAKFGLFLADMVFSTEMKAAIWNYFIQHKPQMKFSSATGLIDSFTDADMIIQSYMSLINDTDQKKVKAELSKPMKHQYFKEQVVAQLARDIFHDKGYYTISVLHDDVVNKAKEVLNSDQYSAIIGKPR